MNESLNLPICSGPQHLFCALLTKQKLAKQLAKCKLLNINFMFIHLLYKM